MCACIAIEGKKQCTWWVINKCVNPSAPLEARKVCTGKLPRFKTEGIREVIL